MEALAGGPEAAYLYAAKEYPHAATGIDTRPGVVYVS
jgi:hypothetical protein